MPTKRKSKAKAKPKSKGNYWFKGFKVGYMRGFCDAKRGKKQAFKKKQKCPKK
jgi:hypothetical protein